MIRATFLLSSLCSLTLLVGACSGPEDLGGEPSTAAQDEAQKKHPKDMAGGGGGADAGTVAANPPPASCDQRHAGVTGIQVLVRISHYQGMITGSNGDHEIAYGNIISTPWVYAKAVVDTAHVQLAMNVASKTDPSGLPKEIPLAVGQVVEAEGEFIPAATANAHDTGGAAAVIHYTHAPCGYLRISGTQYK